MVAHRGEVKGAQINRPAIPCSYVLPVNQSMPGSEDGVSRYSQGYVARLKRMSIVFQATAESVWERSWQALRYWMVEIR